MAAINFRLELRSIVLTTIMVDYYSLFEFVCSKLKITISSCSVGISTEASAPAVL